jgi:rhodanese-related sulfurtransferase
MADQCNIKRWDLLKGRLNNLHPRDLAAWQQAHPNAVLIDCRRTDEYARFSLPGAIHIDYLAYDFWEKIAALPPDGTYLLYCNSCRRSTRACTLMQNGGFTRVFNLEGGLNALVGSEGDGKRS